MKASFIKKITWIYVIAISLISIVVLALIWLCPESATLQYLTMKYLKPFAWLNLFVLVVLTVLRIIAFKNE